MGKEEFKNPHPELPVREPILKLGKMITDRVPIKLGFEKLTADSPEYWGLAPICTDEQANIALKMGVRKPKTLKQMVQITGMDEKELEKQLEQMSFNGLLEYNWENPQHEKQYVLPMFVPGSAEFTNMNSTVLEEHPEMGRFFERMSRLPLEKITPMVPPGGAGIGMHVIPVEKAIDMNNEAISLEKISYWLDKYDGKYAASPCSCRKSRKTYDEGCADDPEDWCIAVWILLVMLFCSSIFCEVVWEAVAIFFILSATVWVTFTSLSTRELLFAVSLCIILEMSTMPSNIACCFSLWAATEPRASSLKSLVSVPILYTMNSSR